MSATSPEPEKERLETLDRAGRQAYQWLLVGSFLYIIIICALARPWLWDLSSANNLGDFLAGLFAPPAFAALAVALYVQRIELRQNTQALVQQTAETRALVAETNAQFRAMESDLKIRKVESKLALDTRLFQELSVHFESIYRLYYPSLQRNLGRRLGDEIDQKNLESECRAMWSMFAAGQKYVWISKTGDIIHGISYDVNRLDGEEKRFLEYYLEKIDSIVSQYQNMLSEIGFDGSKVMNMAFDDIKEFRNLKEKLQNASAVYES